MKKMLICAVIGLLGVSPAYAQDEHRDDHRGGPRNDAHPGGPPPAAPAAAARPAPAPPAAPAAAPQSRQHEDRRPSAGRQAAPAAKPAAMPPAPPPANPAAAVPNNFRGNNNNNNNFRGNNNNNNNARPNPGNNGPNNARNNNGSNNRGGNFSAMRRAFNAPRHYHAPAYHRPRGWYARRWTFGEILPTIFWAQDYWLNDYEEYGLVPPPPGTVWVRDGDDALLIDRISGEIIQVEYDVFD